jgi:hypothetical protein
MGTFPRHTAFIAIIIKNMNNLFSNIGLLILYTSEYHTRTTKCLQHKGKVISVTTQAEVFQMFVVNLCGVPEIQF